jgi:hypothetical protein
VFGELGFILEQPRNRTVCALTDMEVEVIDPRVFSEFYDLEYGSLIRPLLQSMAERLRFTDARLAELQNEKVFYAEKGTSGEKRFLLTISAQSRQTIDALSARARWKWTAFPCMWAATPAAAATTCSTPTTCSCWTNRPTPSLARTSPSSASRTTYISTIAAARLVAG